ncbi:hypothetical protein LINGRAHAP2_LOCUS11865 [Linum grandiflorum]
MDIYILAMRAYPAPPILVLQLLNSALLQASYYIRMLLRVQQYQPKLNRRSNVRDVVVLNFLDPVGTRDTRFPMDRVCY